MLRTPFLITASTGISNAPLAIANGYSHGEFRRGSTEFQALVLFRQSEGSFGLRALQLSGVNQPCANHMGNVVSARMLNIYRC